MATADLLELSRWGATWNAVVEQLSKANAILAIDRRYPTNRCARRTLARSEWHGRPCSGPPPRLYTSQQGGTCDLRDTRELRTLPYIPPRRRRAEARRDRGGGGRAERLTELFGEALEPVVSGEELEALGHAPRQHEPHELPDGPEDDVHRRHVGAVQRVREVLRQRR
eukprot:scaffold96812_cov63-Phaeocystis_antarctica.AAC.5